MQDREMAVLTHGERLPGAFAFAALACTSAAKFG